MNLDEPAQSTDIFGIAASPAPPERGLRWVFIGKNGIRAGWGVLLFVVILIALGRGIGFAVHHFFHPKPTPPDAALPPKIGVISEGLPLFCVLVATAVMALIEKRPVLYYGYKGTARAARFFFGLVWGFVAISALVLTLWKAGLLGFDGKCCTAGRCGSMRPSGGWFFCSWGCLKNR